MNSDKTFTCAKCIEVFNIKLLKHPVFLLFGFSFSMFIFGFYVPYTYMPQLAIALGNTPSSASLLVSIIGIANMFSRFIFGWLGDISANVRFYLGVIVIASGGVITMMIPLLNTYPLLVFYCILFGLFTGKFYFTPSDRSCIIISDIIRQK